MALKTYAFANEFNGNVTVSLLDESDPEVQAGQIFKELGEGESRLAARYVLEKDQIVDAYPGKTDDEVLASILANHQAIPVLDLAQEKKLKIVEVRGYFNAAVKSIELDAAPYEVATWDVQRAEYAEWLKDKTTPTPYVSILAAQRGIDIETLMAKIGYRVSALAAVQGMQHAMESKVEACTTAEEVQAITMPVLG